MTSFDLLSSPIRKYIHDKGWGELRRIQEAAISGIMSSDNNYILASGTASGKTEAAFLPILSKLDFNKAGVQALYISPLIALINDQFFRIEELCKYLDITVTKWHGEANATQKSKLVQDPTGIVLITPESLEAMFANRYSMVKSLFSCLKYVVVDEIHSFLGTDRGTQLKSILYRIQGLNSTPFSIIGLSATIGDYGEAKRFTGNESKTKVFLDRSAKEINVIFRYFRNDGKDASKTAGASGVFGELPEGLMEDLYRETKDSKVLIFPNSRGRAEEIAVKLRKISDRESGHPNYFSHHSSVDREVREYVEHFAKYSYRENFCISCTSTLELGIDIGTVDEIVQIDATHSISSLIQRVGRSGRKDGKPARLCLYATGKWDLLQSMACWLLCRDGFIEPVKMQEKPYDILVHQALSIVRGNSGISLASLIAQLKSNPAFCEIETARMEQVLNHLLEIDFLEKTGPDVIVGVEGEKTVNNRNFYSVFKSERSLKVIYAGITIGELPASPQIAEGENILLAAKIWKIRSVDLEGRKIDVIPAKDGKKPMFFGSGGTIHPKIREKMFEILCGTDEYDFLDRPGRDEIRRFRRDFAVFRFRDIHAGRLLFGAKNRLRFFTFAGTLVNRTLKLIFDVAGIESTLNEQSSMFDIRGMSANEFLSRWKMLPRYIPNINVHIAGSFKDKIMDFSKYGSYLPDSLQIELLRNKYFDVEQTELFLKTIDVIRKGQLSS
ncbi:MAG: DEAD/DEAH box helicase [Prevotellaceae bacterium]|jgi:ATP-dependent Lhr-like helicase|nr:DEAD/DEAH box helicase [Prevotellaceae bacterium]